MVGADVHVKPTVMSIEEASDYDVFAELRIVRPHKFVSEHPSG
jgi:hypothetical protein